MGIYIGLFGGLGGVVGPLILGYSYDQTGSFFWGFASLGLGATFVSFLFIPIFFHERRVKKAKRARAAQASAVDEERVLSTH